MNYPAHNEPPLGHTMSACEVLCWIGYRRVIPADLYYRPLIEMEKARREIPLQVSALAAFLHSTIPDPKPPACPMDDAERRLLEALRAETIHAVSYDEAANITYDLTPNDFRYAVVVSARGGLEPADGASVADYALAATRPTRQNLRFFTSEILKAWPVTQRSEPVILAKLSPKHGGRDYRSADAPLVQEGANGVRSGLFKSSWDAAMSLSPRAKGGGTHESKCKRIARLISVQLSSETNGAD